MATDLESAFFDKVACAPSNMCWEWTGAKNAKGYGNFRSRSAHVVSYEIEHGAVPDGLEVDHTCRNRSCVNPAHLEAVTHQENVNRAKSAFCLRGHPLSGDNVQINVRPDGIRRRCRACRKVHQQRKQERKRANAQR